MKNAALLLSTVLVMGGILFSACSKKGPAEKVGEKLDNTGEQIHDALTPDGPIEKAGKKVDNAVKGIDTALN